MKPFNFSDYDPQTKTFWFLAIGLGIFALCFAFFEFGSYFGVVFLPIIAIGYLANKIYAAKLSQKTREITEASRIHLATVEALATAIDARDQVGVGHVRRTQIFAVGIGKTLNLSAGELEALNTGTLLHDIGKLAVPDHILNKPGKLTPPEMEKAKIHAVVGASILEKIDFPYPVVPTIKYHHEKWDGSGYPDGLMKDKIPLTARILAVADAYDTLRGARPYRPAYLRDDARRILLSEAGKKFDPQIVDVLLRNLRDFETEIEAQGFSYSLDAQSAEEIGGFTDDESNLNYVEQIKRANREVYTLYELSRVFSSSLNLQETLSLFVKKISELVPFESCVVYLLDETEENASAVYTAGDNSAILKEKRVKVGDGATGGVLEKRQPLCKINPREDFTHNQVVLTDEYTAMASLPLIVEEKLLGAVSLYSSSLEGYEEEHMRLLETVSRIASDAISMSLQHAESESRALTDQMTGLPNARSMQIQFEKEAARASRNGSTFHLLMLDLDGFKAVNDTFGHKVGDKMLREISKVMRNQLRDYDYLARYAGDEFLVIAPETDSDAIKELCQRIEKAVCDFILPVGDGEIARVGVSVGSACFPTGGETLDQVVIAADKAMYEVKAERKEKQKQPSAVLQTLIEKEDLPLSFDEPIRDDFIVELDESHILSSTIN